MKKKGLLKKATLALGLVAVFALAGCADNADTPVVVPTTVPTAGVTATVAPTHATAPTIVPTSTDAPVATVEPTATPIPTATATPTPTKGPTSTPKPTPTPTPKLTPTPIPAFVKNAVEYADLKVDGTLTVPSRVSVHDPSIVFDESTETYYIFGSHKAWAKSKDLIKWQTFTTNVNSNFRTLLADNAAWSARGNSKYDVSGNLWAPDVKYNKDMKKWCMYMSVNGDNYYSSIVLLTADKIEGPYEFAGTIVYSGFRNEETAALTDYAQVTGSNNVASRYLSGKAWNSKYGTNAIDPCVFYDEDGELWMSYGSWFGGLFLLKLDNETGLRDYTYTYETIKDYSDEYLGIRISGGYGLTGEGSYIVWDEEAGYYYLYVSYCGLDATDSFSGYHVRLFRSDKVTGPYYDAAGNMAVCTSSGQSQKTKGIKLFGNYYFSSMDTALPSSYNSKGYMSPGHNSAFIDTDGEHYIVMHTRFNQGTEAHQVRVHQQFLNEDGWLVTAVYEHLGSVISDKGYDKNEIAGDYELVNHGLAATTAFTPMLPTYNVKLNADGTITGDFTGTWEQKTGNDGKGYYATMVIKGVTYKGVFFKQYDESKNHTETMTFTLIGSDNQAIWGSKIDETQKLEENIKATLPSAVIGDFELVTSMIDGKITYTSSDSSVLEISKDGTKAIYKKPQYDTSVKLTATYKSATYTDTYEMTLKIKGEFGSKFAELTNLTAYYSFDGTRAGVDYSQGTKYNASVYGAAIVEDSERGTVLKFDGTNDYIKLDSKVTATESLTFSAWVKSDGSGIWSRIFDLGDDQNNSMFLTASCGTGMRVAMKANSGAEDMITASEPLASGKWQHVAVTHNGATKETKLYLNGKLVGTTTVDVALNSFGGKANYIGKSQYSADPYFAGSIDDICIFNCELTEAEIKEYMQY